MKTNFSLINCKFLVLLVLGMLMPCTGTWAQTYYVFRNSATGNYFMTANNSGLARNTGFDPATCLWVLNGSTLSTTINGTTYTLGYDRNGLGTNNNRYQFSNWGVNRGYTAAMTFDGTTASCTVNNRSNGNGSNTTAYVRYNNNAFGFAATASNYAVAQTVTINNVTGSTEDFTIAGTSIITSAGNYDFSHTNKVVTQTHTHYAISNGDNYYDVNGNITTTNPRSETETGYVWSLTGAGSYASINSTSGRLTVTSIPSDDVDMTVTCTLNGVEQQSMTVTLSSATPAGYVIMNDNTHFLGGTSTTNIGSFDPNTCLWTGTSGGRWQNGAGYYLRMQRGGSQWFGYNYTMSLDQTNSSNWNLTGTESGTTGQMLDDTQYNRYVRYNNGWTVTDNSGNTGTNVVFSVLKKTIDITDNTTPPTISAAINSAKDGVQLSHTNVAGTYSPAYEDYIFYNNTHHYWYDGSSHDEKPAFVDFASTSATYTWSIVSGDQYASIDANTGNLKSKGVATTTEQIVRVKLTTTHAASGYSNEQTYDVKIQDYVESPVVAKIGDNHIINKVGVSLTMRGYLEGSYKPAYTKYSFLHESHYLYNGKDYGYNEPALYDDSGCVFTWSLSGEGEDYSSLSSKTGKNPVLTYHTNAGHDVVVTLHLTVTHPDFPSLNVTADPWDVTMYSPTISAPEISFDQIAETVTLSVPSEGTTYYTTDGSDPKTSGTRQIYSAPFSITTSPTTVKAYSERWGTQSSVSEKTIKLKLGKPTISVSDNGVVTISLAGAPAGTEFRYTTDGSDPTDSSNLYDAANKPTLSNGAVIKAIAVKDGYASSDVAEESFSISSGVRDGKVILNDYEDHTWTYYAGVDPEVDGGNYNTNYKGKLYSPNPRNVKITYKSNGGAVSIDEPETEFIYYKTLEESSTAGEYQYQVISNPFSKRPKGKGFGGWQITKGADYIKNKAANATLELDEEIVFNNLGNPEVNVTAAEIEFTATWVDATIKYGTSNISSSDFRGGNYETNLLVLTDGSNNSLTPTYPVTIMMVEPDGSQDYRNNAFTGNITPAATGVTKMEFMRWNSTNTVTCNYHNLWIGRGITSTNRCANMIVGGNTTSTASPQFHVKVESGIYQYMSFLAGYYNNSGTATGTGFDITGGDTNANFTLGNDYDRAKGTNTNLQFQYGLTLGRSGKFASANRSNTKSFNLIVKSGRLGYTYFMENTTTADHLQGGAGFGFYLSSGGSQTYMGTRNVLIEGGDLSTVGSGIDSYNNTTGNSTTPSTTTNYGNLGFNFRMKGGTIHGNVYGGAAKSPAGGNRVMVVTGGQIKGWFAAGCNGTDSDGGQTYGTSWVYIGGNGKVDSEGSTKQLGYASGGNVYAAGAGRTGAATCGEMTFGTNLVVADNSYIERGIYGGGNYGYAKSSTNIYITGGTNKGDTDTRSGNAKGGVYGGANQQDGPEVKIWMTGGNMYGGVYGGCNTKGTINGDVTMVITGGQVGQDADHTENIHGGGYGDGTSVPNNVEITLGTEGQTANGVKVYGNVYGGAALGTTGGTGKHTYVKVYRGTITGDVFGGGMGEAGSNTKGVVTGAIAVDVYGTDPAPDADTYALHGVYGGGDLAPYAGTPTVKVHNCDNSIEYVYGGGNATSVAGTDVTIWGGDKIGNVFGGGNGQVRAANVNGNTNVKIYGGTIGDVYGGSNTNGTIGGTISVNVDAKAETTDKAACLINIDNVYGGGNKAASNVGKITIGCAEHIGAVYGGANQANITGDIDLKIVAGHIDNVFGGNNNSGTISGSVKVTVDDNDSDCGMEIGNVFGGGNLATLSKGPTVDIINGHITGNVFGGGKGDPADHTKGQVTGNPTVTIGTITAGKTVTIDGDVYGGGDAGNVVGTPVITVVNNCDNRIANLYGGGNAADVSGTNVTINGGTFSGMVFGGGHGDKDANPQKEANVNGNVVLNISGGTIYKVFAGSNSKGNITGTANLTVNKTDGSCDLHIRELYGGGNEAAGNAGTIKIQNTGGADEGIGTVYGGANNADINSNIALNITGGNIGDIFGGNNNGGQVKGNITVDINWTGTGVNHVGNVYGGGNIASIDNGISHTVTVNIPNATISGSVFGGGKGKPAVIVGKTNVNIGVWSNTANAIVNGDVFGGGDLAAVEGDCNVTIRNCGTSIAGDLYGGGNAAPVYSTNTTMWGGTVAGNVFGGGNGKDAAKNAKGAQVGYKRDDSTESGSGNATTYIYGGTVGTWNGDKCAEGTGGIFGGSNTNGNIAGNINLTVDEKTSSESGATKCTLKMKELYGAGNQAAYLGDGISFNLGCVDYLEEIYGGAKAADLNTNTILNITSGSFKRVFGGNNISGKLNGSITVNVDETGCNPVTIDELYGGGNLAAYSVYGYEGTAPRTKEQYDALSEEQKTAEGLTTPRTDPAVNIISCTRIDNVYGGGYGESAVMVGSPTVNINMIPGNYAVRIDSDGDGNADNNSGALGTIGTVFGGGNAAEVMGNTYVNVGTAAVKVKHMTGADQTTEYDAGANITGNVYGGGNQADVTGKTNVTVGHE